MNPDRGPLAGRHIVVTQGESHAPVAARLRALGAFVVEAPAIEIAPPEDLRPLDDALCRLESYDWMAFTSANAVDAVREGLRRLGSAAPGVPPRLRFASVGKATSKALAAAFPGASPPLEPAEDWSAAGLLRAFGPIDPIGHVLLPVSDRARTELADGLRGRGARVDFVVAYRTLPSPTFGPALEAAIQKGVDLVLLSSPSAVEAAAAALGPRADNVSVLAIGPTTEAAARGAGFRVAGVAASPSPEGWVEAALSVLSGPA
jgi:uroporphyrinogen-III synthase